MAKYEVFNFGGARDIPYKEHTLHLHRNWGFVTSDKKMINIIKGYPFISIKKLEEKDEGSCIDDKDKKYAVYEKMNFFKLKKLARDNGLKVGERDKKKDILDRLVKL